MTMNFYTYYFSFPGTLLICVQATPTYLSAQTSLPQTKSSDEIKPPQWWLLTAPGTCALSTDHSCDFRGFEWFPLYWPISSWELAWVSVFSLRYALHLTQCPAHSRPPSRDLGTEWMGCCWFRRENRQACSQSQLAGHLTASKSKSQTVSADEPQTLS